MIAAALGLSAFGLYQSIDGSSKAKDAQQGIAQENAALSRIVSADRVKQESLRQDAMNFQSQSQMIQSIRNAQRARSQAVSVGANAGALGSSGLEGSLAQITGQSNEQQATLRYNTSLGKEDAEGVGYLAFCNQMFDINKDIVTKQNESAQRTGQFNQDLSAASNEMDFGKAFMSLGNSMVQNYTPAVQSFRSMQSSLGLNI